MAQTTAQHGALISPEKNGSDTGPNSQVLVFGKDLPDEDPPSAPDSKAEVLSERDHDAGPEGSPKSPAELQAEIDATRAHLDAVADELEARVENKVDDIQGTVRKAKRVLDPVGLAKKHPIGAVVLGIGVIGVGFVAYRFVRGSVPVRLYLALSGIMRELRA